MHDKLVLFFATDGTPSWVTTGEVSDDIERLALAASGKEVIVVVPGEEVLLTSAVLPKLNRARLLQALPFAIEDQLTAEVEDLHFAPATMQADGTTPVAVVAKQKIQQWQDWLLAHKVQADRLIPATCVLPLEEGVWHVAITNVAVVRTGELSGFSCDLPQLGTWLNIAISSAQKKPHQICIHNYSDQSFELNHLNIEVVEKKLSTNQWYKDAAEQTKTPAINLLSGDFASRKARYPQMTKVRKTLSYLTAAWLGLLLLYPLVSYVTLKSRLSTIQGQMWQIYKKQFPNATNMVAPKVRLEEKLHKAGSTLGQNHFLLLLANVGEALHKASDVTIKRLDFQGSMVTLDLTATTDGFSAFTHYLSQQGLQVREQNASVANERVNATVQVE